MAIETPFVQTITNEFPNSDFEAMDPDVEYLRNLAPNPSFEAVGPTIEVHRNVILDPKMTNATYWVGTFGTKTGDSNGLQIDLTDSASQMLYQSAASPAVVGDRASMSVEVEVPLGFSPVTLRLTTYTYGGAGVYLGSEIKTIQPGEVQRFVINSNGSLAPVDTNGIRPIIYFSNVTAGGRVIFRNMIITKTSFVTPYFDGSTSYDSELTPSWTGVANGSASILSGISPARTAVYTGARMIKSNRWSSRGSNSGRLIVGGVGTQGNAAALINLDSPLVIGEPYTIKAKLRLDQPIGTPQETFTRRLRLSPGNELSPMVPNEAGVHDLEWTVIPSAAASGIQIWHGGVLGDADLYIDELIVVKGEYSGSYFDGDTTTDPDLVPSWTGVAHQSASVLSYNPVSAVGGWSSIQWASRGSRSLRLPSLEENGGEIPFVHIPYYGRVFSITARHAGQTVYREGQPYKTSRYPNERLYVPASGLEVGLGGGWWDELTIAMEYDGPYFNGDSEPFMYKGQLVSPRWDYTDPAPPMSTSSFTMFENLPWTPTVEWSTSSKRRYSAGADRGMLYRNNVGYPWSGLVSVNRKGNEGEVGKRYIDGRLFHVSIPSDEYSATIQAFTYPDEFDPCIGNVAPDGPGFVVHGQDPEPFSLSYRTMDGDGTGMEHYKLHFVYDCMALDTGHEHTTINASPEAETFSFDIYGVPISVSGLKPTAYFSINSRDINVALLAGLEKVLYGSDGSQPRLPTIEEIRSYLYP